MTKLTLEDNMMTICMKMSEGNPGALRVCMELLKEAPKIDTDDSMEGMGTFLMLDTEEIYGSKIWMLYKDVCKEQLWKMIAVIRACQLGFVSKSTLHHAIENYGDGLDVDDCIAKVTSQLSGFKIPAEA